MRIAIVESGGKQYRAVEGTTIDVDRLAYEVGHKFDFERVLLMADGDVTMVGTPTVGDIKVSATVVDHVKGPKVISFKYRPKKRIRVKGGHRHFYTRLMIDFIGKAGEDRKPVAAKAVESEKKAAGGADDLTKIEGVGPKVAKVLNEAGISSFADLAGAKAADVQKALDAAGLQMMDPKGWISQAKLAAKGDWEGFEKLQGELKGGRKAKSADKKKEK
ncbi:MAG TPA: 50S ribosomal protein L21 [Anaerolineales bacterium]|nr:50S ribosomal protein L21 [Anaerolineales bacterium]HMX19405.1 50S ribosomal protein L21 [Anaerolineales bacterium]HMX73747.1 50S ribosomal protein L21 [Anaerolineales bacterium]HMZ42340.1 50S ribosomal protein L21 [Anaerolineales bacterium]HNA53411.1 50S ribosomal protein L21 [Anaerolineales bacterium]